MRQIVLLPDPEDGGFTVEVPSLPGCITEGDTVEEAVRNARDAIACWLEGTAAVGGEIPPETFGAQVINLDIAEAPQPSAVAA